MKKLDMLRKVSAKAEVPQGTVDVVLGAFIDVATEAMKEQDSVSLTGFGKFEGVYKEAKEAVNPSNGKRIMVDAKIQPKFKASTLLKENLNK